jgi:putative ABC transport system permease protein
MLRSYLKVAVKVLLRRKFFTLISLFGIAFTLTVLTLATALLDHLFSPAPPERWLDRTLYVTRIEMDGEHTHIHTSPGFGFLDASVRGLPGAQRVSIFGRGTDVVSYSGGQKLRLLLKRTDGEFWKILDFAFVEGGPFTAEDDRAGNRLAVISEGTRERVFHGGSALGRTIDAGGQNFRIVGVVKNVPLTRYMPLADVWVPIGTEPSPDYRKQFTGGYFAMILADDARDLASIKSEFDARVAALKAPDPKQFTFIGSGADTLLESVSRQMFPGPREARRAGLLRAVFVFAGVVFMALPALNLMNINLSRILERASEIGVRKAFGASSSALVGQFLVENVVLTLVGAVIAWIVSAGLLRSINQSGLVPYADFHMNLRILAGGVLVALFFGALSGIYPAWRMSRMHPVQALRRRL